MVFYIIGAIILVGVIAYVAVNHIPKKLHWILSIILLATAGYLLFLINNSIMEPLRFNTEKQIRYTEVIKKLKVIRDAQVAHKTVTGDYTKSGEDLIKFIDTAEFAITQTRNVLVKQKRGLITVDIEKRVVDTIGHEPVRAMFAGKDYKNMLKIASNNNIKFIFSVDEIQKFGNLTEPVFEVKVDKKIVLTGLTDYLIRQELEAATGDEVRGEFISVGSLNEVSENGNWPPYYDKADKNLNKK
ncbi:MAG: hypothetical protein COB98_00075 [Flavobacteriaceae bacterium]|nr:MAG: hypothetical protein COB98_00075 [Flavobacteriaceae bacterium]